MQKNDRFYLKDISFGMTFFLLFYTLNKFHWVIFPVIFSFKQYMKKNINV